MLGSTSVQYIQCPRVEPVAAGSPDGYLYILIVNFIFFHIFDRAVLLILPDIVRRTQDFRDQAAVSLVCVWMIGLHMDAIRFSEVDVCVCRKLYLQERRHLLSQDSYDLQVLCPSLFRRFHHAMDQRTSLILKNTTPAAANATKTISTIFRTFLGVETARSYSSLDSPLC